MRRGLLLLPGLGLLACGLALLAFTAPAHWQIWHITPDLPDWTQLDVALSEPGAPLVWQ